VKQLHKVIEEYLSASTEIQAGKYLIGVSRKGLAYSENQFNRPFTNFFKSQVTVSTYRFCHRPVSNALWVVYCADSGKSLPPSPSWGMPNNYPVVNVTWNEVAGPDGFCDWLSSKTKWTVSLPSEVQWEIAAHNATAIYPQEDCVATGKIWIGRQEKPLPVIREKYITKNKLNLTDMIGNVYTWCADWYGPQPKAFPTNYAGPPVEFFKSVRGASFASEDDWVTRHFSARQQANPDERYADIGFRLVIKSKEDGV